VELRICDLVADPVELLAIAAFLEARLWQLLADPTLDPLVQSDRPDELLGIIAHNEAAAARASLDAELIHWRDGRSLRARDWLQELYPSVLATAQAHGFGCFLLPVQKILRDGNSAERWLRAYAASGDSVAVMQQAIAELTQGDLALIEQLCQLVAA
jgi:predicted glutamate--cysteine ligase